MGDWDDDDFEADISNFKSAEKVEEPVVPTDLKKEAPKPKVAAPPKKAPVFAMESLGRELTSAEKEALQKKNDLALAKDLFGDDFGDGESSNGYADISSKQEFEYWGERVGQFLATRNKAAHYGDMIGKLLGSVTESLAPGDIQKMITYLQQISTAKKQAEKKGAKASTAAAATTTAAAGKKNAKATLKVTKGNDNMYDDYGDGNDDFDDYDDY